MPFSLFTPCWPDPSRDSELTISCGLWICVQLLAVTALTLTLGKLSRWFRVPWFVILLMILFPFLLCCVWYYSYTSGLYWDCILMREEEITEQPMKAERAGSIMMKEAVSFLER